MDGYKVTFYSRILAVIAGALIGAGSVVTKDVHPRAVVLGNPARIKRHIT